MTRRAAAGREGALSRPPLRRNIFPGSCRTSFFISRLKRATETALAGRPVARITSSMARSSPVLSTAMVLASLSDNASPGRVPVSAGEAGRLLGGKRYSNSLRMSSTPSQSLAPCLMRSWQPLLRGESIRPGTAKTWRPYSVAKFAVMSAPLLRFASTTTVPSVMPATMRLRMGKDCLSAGRLKGNCDTTAPPAAMRSNSSAFSGGKTMLIPVPRTAMVRPLAVSAP